MVEEPHIHQITGFLNTPPIWLASQFGLEQFNFPLVNLNAFSPTPIPQKLRLGHQMEHVCKQVLNHCKEYNVLVHNLPIRDGKQTLGEIDFILQDVESKQLIHVELTYKFYLINADRTDSIHKLIGPNKRDAFFTKIEKIRNKQIPLIHSKEGSSTLAEIEIDSTKIDHQVCFKAQLFKPFNHDLLNLSPLNEKCISGYWLRISDLQSDIFKNKQFYIPTKSQWVIEPHIAVHWISYTKASLEINDRLHNQNSPMVWMKKNETEFEKFFVVWW